ncbi:MAG: GtrA family protein [Candidatus Saccharibacteria bacterium]|nr:GtrA family protein [Moraxellaceae bacterium]
MTRRLVKFVVVGSIGFGIDAGVVMVLSWAGLSPILARIPSISFAIAVTWFLNRKLTFNISEPATAKELGRYISVALISAILNFVLYSLLIVRGVIPTIAIAISTVVLMFFSFFGYKLFAFR